MKKLLALIGSISLGVVGTSDVIACSNSANASNDSATEIANKISNKDLAVPPITPTDTTNKTTIQNITQALVKANPSLNSYDLSKITYAKSTLQMNTGIAVTANIMVSQQDKTSVSLTITLLPTANFLKAQVTTTDIKLPIGSHVNFDPANYTDLQAMNSAVFKANNKNLNLGDMVYFQYAKSTLGFGSTGKPVSVTVKVPGDTAGPASLTLSVAVPNHSKKVADEIKNKNISVAMSNPQNITSPANTKILNNALFKVNQTTLNSTDLKYLRYSSATLSIGKAVKVELNVVVSADDKTTTPIDLMVTLVAADDIAKLITDSDIDIATIKLFPEAAVQTDNPIVTAVINNSLLQYYPSLTTEDFQFFSYSSATLITNQQVDVTLQITIADNNKASKDLKITMTSAATIMGNITNKDVSVPSTTPPDTTNPTTIGAINTALKTANPDLNNGDVLSFSYNKTTLEAGKAVAVTLSIKLYVSPNQSDLVSETIMVTLQSS